MIFGLPFVRRGDARIALLHQLGGPGVAGCSGERNFKHRPYAGHRAIAIAKVY